MKAGNCRHFTGIMNSTCRVGIAYKLVRDETQRPYGLPCLRISTPGKPRDCATSCEKFDAYTADEEKAWRGEIAKSLDQTFVARNAIVSVIGEYKNGKSGNASGAMVCPVCSKGLLHYSRAAMNGHIHAACNTENCVRWME